MVIPVEEPQEEQDDVVVPEMEIEVEKVTSTSSKTKDQSKFDFAVGNTDRTDLVVYTVSTKPAEEDWRTLIILAPSYGAALEAAGISKANTVKVSEAIFEG